MKLSYQIAYRIFKEIVKGLPLTKNEDKYIPVIKSALEKQIPKKPTPHKVEGGKIKIGNGWWCEGTTVYKCPCCNSWITQTYKYCIDCGQALDWSDTE